MVIPGPEANSEGLGGLICMYYKPTEAKQRPMGHDVANRVTTYQLAWCSTTRTRAAGVAVFVVIEVVRAVMYVAPAVVLQSVVLALLDSNGCHVRNLIAC